MLPTCRRIDEVVFVPQCVLVYDDVAFPPPWQPDQKEMLSMPYVIAEPCIDVQDQACARVCPVACIHFEPGKDRKLYIDPDECIDCGACEPVCPVEAIFAELDLPTKWRKYGDIDALWFRDKEAARAKVEAVQVGS